MRAPCCSHASQVCVLSGTCHAPAEICDVGTTGLRPGRELCASQHPGDDRSPVVCQPTRSCVSLPCPVVPSCPVAVTSLFGVCVMSSSQHRPGTHTSAVSLPCPVVPCRCYFFVWCLCDEQQPTQAWEPHPSRERALEQPKMHSAGCDSDCGLRRRAPSHGAPLVDCNVLTVAGRSWPWHSAALRTSLCANSRANMGCAGCVWEIAVRCRDVQSQHPRNA